MPLEKLGFLLLMGLIVMDFSRFLDLHFHSLHLPGITQGALLLIALLTGAFMRGARSRISTLMIILTVWMFACLPTAYWRGGTMGILTGRWMKEMLTFLLLSSLIATPRQFRRAMYALVLGMLMGAFLVHTNNVESVDRLAADAGTYANANEFAINLLLTLPWVGFIVTDPRRNIFRKVVALGIGGIFLISVLKTGSREALIALTVIFVSVFFHVSVKDKFKIGMAAMIAILLFFAAVPSATKVRYFTMFSRNVDVESTDEARVASSAIDSSQDRWSLLTTSISVALHHPIFGIGAGNFPTYRWTVLGATHHMSWNGTHNTYTEFFAEEGIPGGVLFIALLVVAFRQTNQIYKRANRIQLPAAKELATLAFTWRCSLSVFATLAFFAHMGYELTTTVVLGFSAAFGLVGVAELARLEAQRRTLVAAPAQPEYPGKSVVLPDRQKAVFQA